MHTRRRLVFVIVLLLGAAAAHLSARAATNFNVTNSGATAYVVDGVNNATLNLVRGQTYTFTVSATGHPFWIATARGAASASTNAFPGVTNNGMAVATVTLAVPLDPNATPTNMLFYQCGIHDAMGGTLNISSPAAAPVPASGVIPLVGLAVLLAAAALVIIRRRGRVARG